MNYSVWYSAPTVHEAARLDARQSLDAHSQADVHNPMAGNAGSSNVAYLLSQGRNFAGPTWLGHRATREVKKWAAF